MSEKQAGWYYVGEGKLRYRDDYGWTEFYMDTDDARVQDWPPPKPRTMMQQLREDEARRAAIRPPRRVLSWRRSRPHGSAR